MIKKVSTDDKNYQLMIKTIDWWQKLSPDDKTIDWW